MKIDSIQADILKANKVNVARGEWGARGPGPEVQQHPVSGSSPCLQRCTSEASPTAIRAFTLAILMRIRWPTSHTSRRRTWKKRRKRREKEPRRQARKPRLCGREAWQKGGVTVTLLLTPLSLGGKLGVLPSSGGEREPAGKSSINKSCCLSGVHVWRAEGDPVRAVMMDQGVSAHQGKKLSRREGPPTS